MHMHCLAPLRPGEAPSPSSPLAEVSSSNCLSELLPHLIDALDEIDNQGGLAFLQELLTTINRESVQASSS